MVEETFAKTEIRKEGTVDAALLQKEEASLKTKGDAKITVHETLEKDGELLEDEEWVTDANGTRRKEKKKGFFGQLKDKLTGHQ